MNSKTDKDTHRITYHIFEISTEPFIPEIIGGLMWELDITGINELEDRLIVFANQDRDVNRRQFENLLIRLANENIIERYDIHQGEIKDRNWNEEWEKQINVIPISDHLIIKPTFRKYQKTSDQIVVTIDPKMSFGTGEHQSTKLGLLLLEKYIKPDNRVFDVGTGTGILAISALKMGAGYALAIDIDDWSVLNSRENAKLNSVLGKIVIRKDRSEL